MNTSLSKNNCNAVTRIDGGIINEIYELDCEDGRYILKQFSTKANADLGLELTFRRYHVEKACYQLLEDNSAELIDFQDTLHVLVCEKLPSERRLDRIIEDLDDHQLTEIGEALAATANQTYNRDELADRFNNTYFQELKYQYKYYDNVEDKPHLHAIRDEVMQKLRNDKHALALGDVRATNVFYADKPYFIDFEGAYYCDNAIDIAYLLTEFIIRGLVTGNDSYNRQAEVLWNSYKNSFEHADQDFQRRVVKHIGFHLIDAAVGVITGDYPFVKQPEYIVERAEEIILECTRIQELIADR